MSIQLPHIDIFRYNSVVSLLPIQNLTQEAGTIRQSILHNSNMTLFHNLEINVTVLERHNVNYSEKQIRGIDENFFDYNNGIRLPQIPPRNNPPGRLTYLIEKAYSGDVSGEIGESIFAYLLIDALGIDGRNIGHLRPETRRGQFTPDFLIFEQNNFLNQIFGQPYNPPLFAEIKSSTGIMSTKTITDALIQLRTVMIHQKHGLLFLLFKQFGQTYRGLLVGVTR